MWVDVGNLIRNHVPDKNGQTLPSDLTEDSYEFQYIEHTAIRQFFEAKVSTTRLSGTCRTDARPAADTGARSFSTAH